MRRTALLGRGAPWFDSLNGSVRRQQRSAQVSACSDLSLVHKFTSAAELRS